VKRFIANALIATVALISGCSTGDDAVAQGGTFEFVAPGGQTDIIYDPPQSRGRLTPLHDNRYVRQVEVASLNKHSSYVWLG
jgi:hypothetical protein